MNITDLTFRITGWFVILFTAGSICFSLFVIEQGKIEIEKHYQTVHAKTTYN